ALRRTNGFDGGDPVVVRFLQSLLSPTPRKQTLVAGGQTIARGVRTAGFGLYCSRRGLLRWHELYLSPAGDSEILLRPLVDALQRLLQILQRIGHAEAQVAFSVFAKGRSRKGCHSSLLQQRVRQRLRLPASLHDVGKNVECAFGHAAGEAFDLVQSRDEHIAPPLELSAHMINRTLVPAQRFD